MIRSATVADAPGIAAIWNPVIRDTTVTFNPVQKSEPEVAALTKRGDPFLVWAEPGRILGFTRCCQFRCGLGYLHTVEHTILLHPDGRGRGGGRALMLALCDLARLPEVGFKFGRWIDLVLMLKRL